MEFKTKKKQEKPQYGWYVKNLIIGFISIGLVGVILFIFGISKVNARLIYILVGLCLIILFLWPSIGLAIINLRINDDFYNEIRIKTFQNYDKPNILDVGCGTGRTAIKIAKLMKNKGKLYGIDIYNKQAISGNNLDTIRKNAKLEGVSEWTDFRFGSATEIPFEDKFFEVVNVSSVFHELHEKGGEDKALKEIIRVLKPNGGLHFSEWNRKSWQVILTLGICCFVFKSAQYWIDLLKKYGFEIQMTIKHEGFYFFTAKRSNN